MLLMSGIFAIGLLLFVVERLEASAQAKQKAS